MSTTTAGRVRVPHVNALALLGTLLVFTASGAVIRAAQLGATGLISLSVLALAAMLGFQRNTDQYGHTTEVRP